MAALTPADGAASALAVFGHPGGSDAGDHLPVRSPVVRIGRGAQNELVLADDSVSATHARLEYLDAAWRLTDLNSTNGTYVEGVRLAPEVPTPLADLAQVRFGGVRLQFRARAEADAARARAEYAPPPPPETIAARRGTRFPLWLVLLLLLLVVLAVLFFAGVFTGGEPVVVGAEARERLLAGAAAVPAEVALR